MATTHMKNLDGSQHRIKQDRETGLLVLRVSPPYGRAKSVSVGEGPNEKPVSEWELNERYSPNDRVVDCLLLHSVDNLDSDDELKTYTYPVSRLESVKIRSTLESGEEPPSSVDKTLREASEKISELRYILSLLSSVSSLSQESLEDLEETVDGLGDDLIEVMQSAEDSSSSVPEPIEVADVYRHIQEFLHCPPEEVNVIMEYDKMTVRVAAVALRSVAVSREELAQELIDRFDIPTSANLSIEVVSRSEIKGSV